MTRSSLYVAVAALAMIVVGMACYIVYQQSQEPSLQIRVDGQGISVNGNG